ncbi:MAG: NADH-quinone oxidoreductase subunit C [Chloroflexi bacterium]|nr:NADH-quinone oxidoreductase subunit C [Chloroflexota bacterium]
MTPPDGPERESERDAAAQTPPAGRDVSSPGRVPDAGTTPAPDPSATDDTGTRPVTPPVDAKAQDAPVTTPPAPPAAGPSAPDAAGSAPAPAAPKPPRASAEAPAAEAAAAAAAADAPPAPRPAAARPAREAEPKEAPRVAPPPGSINDILVQASGASLNAAYMVPDMQGESVAVEVDRDALIAVLTAARDEPRLALTYLRSLSGVDWQDEGLEVVYHLASLETRHHLTVKTRVTYDDPVVPSVAGLFPAADWHERETRDMFGIVFDGHPNLVPLLLPDDMTDHFPLRKDNPLQEIEEWQGDNLREGAGEDE